MSLSSQSFLRAARSRICRSCQRSLSIKANYLPNTSSSTSTKEQKPASKPLPNDTPRSNKQSNQNLLTMLESLRQGAEAKAHARRAAAAEKTASEKPSLSKYINAASMMQFGNRIGDNTRLTERQRKMNDLGRIQEMSDSRELEIKMRGKLGRSWDRGDVYAPKDLGVLEQKKWMERQQSSTSDPFLLSGRNPLEFYKNFTVLSEYMTSTGRIRPRTQTGLTRKNQRDMAKAIRRAIGIGLIPATYKHPQLLGRAVGIGSHGLY